MVGSSNRKYTITSKDFGKVFSVYDSATGHRISIERVYRVGGVSYQYLQYVRDGDITVLEKDMTLKTDPRSSKRRWYFVQMSKLEQLIAFGKVLEKERPNEY